MDNIVVLMSICVTFGFLGYRFAKIKVPVGFENHLNYKLVHILLQVISLIAGFCGFLGICQAIVYKTFFNVLQTKGKYDPKDSIKVKDSKIENIPIRIITPKLNEERKLPLLIYYHGGGYVFGSIDACDGLAQEFSKKLQMTVISIEYRLAPENKYPIPIDDCWTATEYIFKNHQEFNIDVDKIVLAGDSAGGGIATIMSQRLIERIQKCPKLQVLIYPWLQHLNFSLPSYEYYRKKSSISLIGSSLLKLALWYLGIKTIEQKLEDELLASKHLALIEDKKLREKYLKYLDPKLIPDKYKIGHSYYNDFKDSNLFPLINSELDSSSILKNNTNLALTIKNLFNNDVSPGLVDDENLKKLPKTYIVVTELDELKDEALIYSERLKQNGVFVHVAYYKDGYHGMIFAIKEPLVNTVSIKIIDEIIDFIKENI